MNNLSFRKITLSGALNFALLGCPVAAWSQGTAFSPQVGVDNLFRQRQAVFLDSAPLFIAGNYSSGEQLLFSVGPQKPGTAAWQHDAGLRLYSMAIYLRAQGHEAKAREAVRRALGAFELANTMARASGNLVAAADAMEQAAHILDFFLGDVQSALAKMIEAQRLNPHGKNVARALVRLRSADEHLSPRGPAR
jgi:hypothetical protein